MPPLLNQEPVDVFTEVTIKRGPFIINADLIENDEGELFVGRMEVSQIRPALVDFTDIVNINPELGLSAQSSRMRAKVRARRVI